MKADRDDKNGMTFIFLFLYIYMTNLGYIYKYLSYRVCPLKGDYFASVFTFIFIFCNGIRHTILILAILDISNT